MSTHLVAIVGRPNVGKSTLFNRIIGAQKAIVHDEPGVTRDRHYATAEWAGKQFTLIDTGGFVPASEKVFEKAIREQSQIAISEADKVIFMVDAQEGATGTDKEIAQILRKANKKVVLVVNKVDNASAEAAALEFHELGLGEPVSLSALAGRKVGDFLDFITQDFSINNEDSNNDTRLKLAVIGKPNVGKSSLVNAFIGEERSIVTPIAGTTRDPVDTVLKYHSEEIVLIDTAGLIKKKRLRDSVDFYSTVRTLRSIERCNVAMILFDASEPLENQDLHVVESAVARNRGVVIGVNKWDVVVKETDTAKLYEETLRARLRKFDYIPIVFISALTKQRIGKLLEVAKQVHTEMLKRVNTSELNDQLLADILHYPPSTKTGKDIKIKYVTQVKANPPVFVFFANEPQLVSETYKRYLENRIRERFGFSGVPLALSFRKKSK
jgi:GTP-binding protein